MSRPRPEAAPQIGRGRVGASGYRLALCLACVIFLCLSVASASGKEASDRTLRYQQVGVGDGKAVAVAWAAASRRLAVVLEEPPAVVEHERGADANSFRVTRRIDLPATVVPVGAVHVEGRWLVAASDGVWVSGEDGFRRAAEIATPPVVGPVRGLVVCGTRVFLLNAEGRLSRARLAAGRVGAFRELRGDARFDAIGAGPRGRLTAIERRASGDDLRAEESATAGEASASLRLVYLDPLADTLAPLAAMPLATPRRVGQLASDDQRMIAAARDEQTGQAELFQLAAGIGERGEAIARVIAYPDVPTGASHLAFVGDRLMLLCQRGDRYELWFEAAAN